MIYTVTFNPALDYIVRVEQFNVGEVNRAAYSEIMAGGKGVNVSLVLKNLGEYGFGICRRIYRGKAGAGFKR